MKPPSSKVEVPEAPAEETPAPVVEATPASESEAPTVVAKEVTAEPEEIKA
jgi:hypothetical protein